MRHEWHTRRDNVIQSALPSLTEGDEALLLANHATQPSPAIRHVVLHGASAALLAGLGRAVTLPQRARG
jgi:hypothetical protein